MTSARIQVLLAALLFSTGGTAIKFSGLSGWQIAGFRSGIAALVLWIALPQWRRVADARVLPVAVAYAATLVLFATANTLTTAANSIFLQGSAPFYVLLLSPRLLGEPISRRDLAVMALVGAGLALFFAGAEHPLATAPDPARGNLVAAASGITWAFTLIGLRRLGRSARTHDGDPTGAAVVLGNALAFAVCLPMAFPVQGAGPADWIAVAYLGVVQIGLAYAFLVRGVRAVPALEVSLLLILEPVASAILAWLVHGEVPGPWSTAGCAIILIGVAAQAWFAPRAPAAVGRPT